MSFRSESVHAFCSYKSSSSRALEYAAKVASYRDFGSLTGGSESTSVRWFSSLSSDWCSCWPWRSIMRSPSSLSEVRGSGTWLTWIRFRSFFEIFRRTMSVPLSVSMENLSSSAESSGPGCGNSNVPLTSASRYRCGSSLKRRGRQAAARLPPQVSTFPRRSLL